MTDRVLTRRDLDQAPVDGAFGLDALANPEGPNLHARCHEGAPLEVAYAHGVLTLRCHRCQQRIVRIGVASFWVDAPGN